MTDKPIARCMGGKFCNHQPGTCTATVGQSAPMTETDTELVERLAEALIASGWAVTREMAVEAATAILPIITEREAAARAAGAADMRDRALDVGRNCNLLPNENWPEQEREGYEIGMIDAASYITNAIAALEPKT